MRTLSRKIFELLLDYYDPNISLIISIIRNLYELANFIFVGFNICIAESGEYKNG